MREDGRREREPETDGVEWTVRLVHSPFWLTCASTDPGWRRPAVPLDEWTGMGWGPLLVTWRDVPARLRW